MTARACVECGRVSRLVRQKCPACYKRWLKKQPHSLKDTSTIEERFWAKVSPAPALGCWQWTASLNSDGYGNFSADGVIVKAHRWAYEALRSEIPRGLQLDHLCRNRACVNPWHLEPVTNRENRVRALMPLGSKAYTERRTHCSKGHELTPENLRVYGRVLSTGTRIEGRACRTCDAARARRRYAKKRAS